MSKLFLAALATGGVAAGLIAAANLRKAETRGAKVPIDDELNDRPYVVDPKLAHQQHLDEDGRLRTQHLLSKARVPVPSDTQVTTGTPQPIPTGPVTVGDRRFERETSTTEVRQVERVFDELQDSKAGSKLRSEYAYEHEKAIKAQVRSLAENLLHDIFG
jgi:hypothetical protein